MFFEKRESKKAKKGYTWTVMFYYTDSYGIKRRYRKGGFSTKAEAQKHGTARQKELEESRDKPEEHTFAEVFEAWRRARGTRLAPSTLQSYDIVYNVMTSLHGVPVGSMTYPVLLEFMEGLDLSESTKLVVRTLLVVVLNFAMDCGFIDDNPARRLRGHYTRVHEEEPPLSLEQVQAVCEAIGQRDRHATQSARIFVWICYYSGLRANEALALDWPDVDTDARTLDIHGAVDNVSGEVVERTKTKSSRAILPMASPLAEILKGWKEINAYPVIICDKNGKRLSYQQISRMLRKAGNSCGIRMHAHRLRHTFVSNLIQAGADPKSAALLARHADVSITLNIYTQMTSENLADALALAFESPEKIPK